MITYCIVFKGEFSHDQRWHVQNISCSLDTWFLRHANGEINKHTHKQTDRQTARHTDSWSQYCTFLLESKWKQRKLSPSICCIRRNSCRTFRSIFCIQTTRRWSRHTHKLHKRNNVIGGQWTICSAFSAGFQLHKSIPRPVLHYRIDTYCSYLQLSLLTSLLLTSLTNGQTITLCLQSIYNNGLWRCHATRVAYMDGRTDGGATVGRGRHGRQAASADRLRAGIEGLGGGGQAEIAMSRQGRGLRGRTGGRVQAIPPQSGVTTCTTTTTTTNNNNNT